MIFSIHKVHPPHGCKYIIPHVTFNFIQTKQKSNLLTNAVLMKVSIHNHVITGVNTMFFFNMYFSDIRHKYYTRWAQLCTPSNTLLIVVHFFSSNIIKQTPNMNNDIIRLLTNTTQINEAAKQITLLTEDNRIILTKLNQPDEQTHRTAPKIPQIQHKQFQNNQHSEQLREKFRDGDVQTYNCLDNSTYTETVEFLKQASNNFPVIIATSKVKPNKTMKALFKDAAVNNKGEALYARIIYNDAPDQPITYYGLQIDIGFWMYTFRIDTQQILQNDLDTDDNRRKRERETLTTKSTRLVIQFVHQYQQEDSGYSERTYHGKGN